MSLIRWLIGGIIGGLVGALIWMAVGYFAHAESAWIAWLIGFLVGAGVRYAAFLAEQEENIFQGIVAAGIAFTAILLGKVLVFWAMGGWDDNKELRDMVNKIGWDDEAMTAGIARDIATDLAQKGKPVAWPPGVTADEASKQRDFPPAIWKDADAKWKAIPVKDREQKKKGMLMALAMAHEALKKPQFESMFSLFDFLWIGLAVLTAYKIGVGTYGTDD